MLADSIACAARACPFSLEAWVTASATHTNYPAFISYGLDTASPYEAYVLQAPLINGTKPPEV